MAYRLELNFDEYYVVNEEDGSVEFVGDFEEAVDVLNGLIEDE